jgi:hypothetical protein
MSDESDVTPEQPPNGGRDKKALELLFILIVGAIIVAAFISSLSYPVSSARAPWIIIVPLIVLVAIQINRTRQMAGLSDIARILKDTALGHREIVNKVLSLIGWMILLLGAIYLAGHYAGIVVFMFVLLRFVGKESAKMSLFVTLAVAAIIYALFEQVFNIELYRGVFF